MGKLFVMLAAAGVAAVAGAGASAQTGWEFTLEEDIGTAANPLRPGQATATVTLAARFGSDRFAFAGARFSVHADEAGWGQLGLLPVQLPPEPVPGPYPDPFGRTPGTISGGDVIDAIVGQLHIGPFVADPSNPIPLWRAEFTVTDFAPRETSLSTTTEEFRVYPAPGQPSIPARTADEGSATIYVIPAPAGLALLGLGAMAAARRRRGGRALANHHEKRGETQ